MNGIVERSNDVLVRTIGSVPMTDSRLVAEKFGVEHYNLLRLIDGLIAEEELVCVEDFNGLTSEGVEKACFDCVKSDYLDSHGERRPMYHLTEVGFALVGMASKSEGARRWRRQFVEAFQGVRDAMLRLERELSESAVAAVQLTCRNMPEAARRKFELTLKNENNWSHLQVLLVHKIRELITTKQLKTGVLYEHKDVFEILQPYTSNKDFYRTMLNISRKGIITMYIASTFDRVYKFKDDLDFSLFSSQWDRSDDENKIMNMFFAGRKSPDEIWEAILRITHAQDLKDLSILERNVLAFLAKRLAENKEYIRTSELTRLSKDYKKLVGIGKGEECLKNMVKKGYIYPSMTSYEIQGEALIASGIEVNDPRLKGIMETLKEGMACEDGEWVVKIQRNTYQDY
jgi:Rha family phage regulatory protein